MKRFVRALKISFALTIVMSFVIACSSNSESGNPSSTASSDTGNQGGDKEKVTLRVMLAKDPTKDLYFDWMSENMKLFKEKNPHIDFDVTANASGDQYLTVVTTEMAANNVPDIVQGWTLERMRPFVESGRLLDLHEAIESDPEWKGFLQEEPLKATTFDGGIYGIPSTLDAEVIYYNKDVFEKYNLQEPQTYEEFLNIVKTLKENGIIPMTVPNKDSWVGTIPYMMIAERIGGLEAYQNIVMDHKEPWTSEPFIKAANTLQDLMKLGAFEKDVNSVLNSESEAKLAEGKAGMYAMGTWRIPSLYEKLGDKLGIFNFPDITGGKGSKDHFIIIPNISLSIAKETKHKEEAIAFLKFAFSQERQEALAKLGFLSTTKVKTNKEEVNPVAVELQEQLTKSTGSMYPWDVPLGALMGAELNNATQILYMGKDPEEVFGDLQKKQDNLKK